MSSPNSKLIRVDRMLSNLGLTSRRSARDFLYKNRVVYSSLEEGGEERRILSIHDKVRGADSITINGEPILPLASSSHPRGFLYLAVYKPKGYTCTRALNEGRSIFELLPKEVMKMHPPLMVCGRLDKWATGLVLVTQDGEFCHRVIQPKKLSSALAGASANSDFGNSDLPASASSSIAKIYEVQGKDIFTGVEAERFASGDLMLRGEEDPCKPAKFKVIDPVNNVAHVTLWEGRYHQIRRMFAAVGNWAQTIRRVAIGPISLGNLKPGTWRHLSVEEINSILK